jgi:hypothetical protein
MTITYFFWAESSRDVATNADKKIFFITGKLLVKFIEFFHSALRLRRSALKNLFFGVLAGNHSADLTDYEIALENFSRRFLRFMIRKYWVF